MKARGFFVALLLLLIPAICRAGYDVLVKIGDDLMQKGNYREAAKYLKQACEDAPQEKLMSLYIDIGICFRKIKNFDGAIDYYRKAAELSPDMGDIFYNIGLAYYYKGDLKKAILSYRKAQALSPKSAEFYGSEAMAWRDMGKPEKAMEVIKNALKMDPGYPGGYVIYANCLAD